MTTDNKRNESCENMETLEELKSQIEVLQQKIDVLIKDKEQSQKDSASKAQGTDQAFVEPCAQRSDTVSQEQASGNFVQQPAVQSIPASHNSATSYAPVQSNTAQSGQTASNSYGKQNECYRNQYSSPQQPYAAPVYAAPHEKPLQVAQKDHVAAALLAIFLGIFGVHKFYLGYNTAAFIMLAVTLLGVFFLFVPSFVVWLIGIIEGIVYLTKSQDEFEYLYVRNKRLWF